MRLLQPLPYCTDVVVFCLGKKVDVPVGDDVLGQLFMQVDRVYDGGPLFKDLELIVVGEWVQVQDFRWSVLPAFVLFAPELLDIQLAIGPDLQSKRLAHCCFFVAGISLDTEAFGGASRARAVHLLMLSRDCCLEIVLQLCRR
jgi:hypothetical protein